KYKEAFDLAAAGRKDELIDELERQLLEVRRARMLGLLGHKDAAAQLFARSIAAVNRDNNWALARELVRCEVRAGMREQALAHASECLAILLERDGQHEPEGLLEPLFGPRKEAARTLWLELREKYGDLTPP